MRKRMAEKILNKFLKFLFIIKILIKNFNKNTIQLLIYIYKRKKIINKNYINGMLSLINQINLIKLI